MAQRTNLEIKLSLLFVQETESKLIKILREGIKLRSRTAFPGEPDKQREYADLFCNLLRGVGVEGIGTVGEGKTVPDGFRIDGGTAGWCNPCRDGEHMRCLGLCACPHHATRGGSLDAVSKPHGILEYKTRGCIHSVCDDAGFCTACGAKARKSSTPFPPITATEALYIRKDLAKLDDPSPYNICRNDPYYARSLELKYGRSIDELRKLVGPPPQGAA